MSLQKLATLLGLRKNTPSPIVRTPPDERACHGRQGEHVLS